MELKQIKELMAAMGRSGTKRLALKTSEYEIELERETVCAFPLEPMPIHPEMHKRHTLPKAETALHHEREEVAGTYITSPMVGTFYNASGPGEALFVRAGDKVEKNTVVCIIEAMKVMNEIKAGVSGMVEEVMVEGGSPVEFGSKLFRITPN